MNIVSDFTTKLLSKAIQIIVRKKLGYDVDLKINKLNLSIKESRAHIHLDADADLSKEELMKIIKSAGLG